MDVDPLGRVPVDHVSTMSISQLRTYLKSRGISMVGCVEKTDLVALVVMNETSDSPKMPIAKSEPKPASTSNSSSYSSTPSGGTSYPGSTYSSGPTGGAYTTGGYSTGTGYSSYPSGQSHSSSWGGTAPAKPKTRIEDSRSYYEILGIEKDATPAQIKRGYYKMARKYHPDKNPDDEHAEEMFKLISEAYNILSDEEKKIKYDKYGKDYVRSAESGGADMGNLLSMLFGGGQFDDVFGELSILEMLTTMDTEGDTNPLDAFSKDEKHDEKVNALAEILRDRKIASFVAGDEREFRRSNTADIKEKLLAPGGPSLLSSIGYIYVQSAKMHSERWFGLESFVSGIQEKGHLVTSTVSIINDMRKMAKIQQELEGEGEALSTEAQQKAMDQGLNIMWKMGKLELESTVKAVCSKVIKGAPDKHSKKRTVAALRQLGQMYLNAAKSAESGKKTGAPSLDEVQESLIKDAQRRSAEEEVGTATKEEGSYTKFPAHGSYSKAHASTKSGKKKKQKRKEEPEELVESDGGVDDIDGLD